MLYYSKRKQAWRTHSSPGVGSIGGRRAELIHFRLCYHLNVQFNIIPLVYNFKVSHFSIGQKCLRFTFVSPVYK